MALVHPSYDDFIALINAEIRRQIPTIDPTVFGSWARALSDGTAATAAALDLVLRDLERQLFPQTAEGEFLDRWGNYDGLERNPASEAQGLISIPGTPGTIVNAGVTFRNTAGVVYETINTTTVATVTQSISNLTAVGTTITATTASNHNLATGMTVDVSGADQAEYNINDIVIAVTGLNEFQYTVPVAPGTSPATGTINYVSDFVSVLIRSTTVGSDTNSGGGASLNIVNAVNGLTGEAFAQFEGVTGGADLETDPQYRERILLSRSIIEGVFTADQIQLAALSVTGNTRAFVIRATDTTTNNPPQAGVDPAPGQVVIYVLRDNDDNITPSQDVLDQTKAVIIADGALPAHTSETDVGVFAPALVSTDFTFSSITPNTTTMQQAIRDQLAAFFEDQVEFQQDVNQNIYLAAIQNTTDQQTGDLLESFTLSTPSGNITVGNGQIAVLGNVTF